MGLDHGDRLSPIFCHFIGAPLLTQTASQCVSVHFIVIHDEHI
jgi:hypothetical protein